MINAIAVVIREINDAWRSGNTAALADYFHPDMVIVGPGYTVLARGAAACIASYRDFLQVSTVHSYQESNLVIHETDNVAIVTYGWDMDYEQNGKRSREKGSDLFVFERSNSCWRAVWRAVTFA